MLRKKPTWIVGEKMADVSHLLACPDLVKYNVKAGGNVIVVAGRTVEVGTAFGGGTLNKSEATKNMPQESDDASEMNYPGNIKESVYESWISAIRKSDNVLEQNLVSLKDHDKTVYIAFKTILEGEELVCFRDDDVAGTPLSLRRKLQGIRKHTCYRCSRCSEVFLCLTRLGSHLYFSCRHKIKDDSHSTFESKIPAKIRDSVTFDVFHCIGCKKLFLNRRTLREHSIICGRVLVGKIHSETKAKTWNSHCCQICGTWVGAQVIRHERTHFAWDSFLCTICGKVERRKDKCLEHMSKHMSLCLVQTKKKAKEKKEAKPKVNENKSELNDGASFTSQAIYKCGECSKTFRYRHVLERHALLHQQGRPFSCQSCGNHFKRKDHLIAHCKRLSHDCKCD